MATEDGSEGTAERASGRSDGGYDLVELQQRLAGSFSGAELRALAQELGVPSTQASASSAPDLAHDVVRHFERAHRVEALVEELRQRQPLVEWPARRPAPTVPDRGDDLVIPDLPLIHGGELAELEPEAVEPPSSEGLRALPPVPPIPRPPVSSRWPGTSSDDVERAPPRGVDPKILIVVSALTLAIAVVAFVAGLSWSGDGGATTADSDADAGPAAVSADASAPALDSQLGDGIAGKAARALRRGLRTVARKCELPSDVAPSADIFAGVYQQCGPLPLGAVPRAGSRPRRPASSPGAPDEPEPAIQDTPQAITTTNTPTVATPGAACLAGCSEQHGACGAGCGAEPTKGSEYEAFQACRSKCMTAYSKCRLRCQ